MLGVTKLSSPTPDRRRSSTYFESNEEIPPPLSPSFREKVPHYEIPSTEGHDLFLLGLNDERFIIPKTGSFTTSYTENNPNTLAPKSWSFSGKSKKRVSFTDSNDITELNLAREIALRNRDRQQDQHSFQEEAHSSKPEQEAQSSRRRRSSVAVEDWGNVLDQISSELNIRPIRRRSEGSKFNTTDKFHSENDLVDRSLRIPPRKLSAPITPVKAEDVNVIISEISEELNIGPRFSRSRSSSRTLQSPVVLSNSSGEDTSRLNSLTSDSFVEPNTSSDSSNLLVTPSIVSSDSDGIVVKNLLVADEATQTTDGGVAGGGSSSTTATIMDRSVDSIGSCSLDVDLSTDFSGMSLITTSFLFDIFWICYVTSLVQEINHNYFS